MAVFLVLFIVLVSQSAATLYDIKDEVCCRGNILQLSIYDRKNMSCCGTALFNRSTSRCCDGHVLDIPNHQHGNIYLTCCGDTWYDSKVNKIQSCCKNTMYSLNTQRCNHITGEVIERDVNLGFCGTKVYNKTSQICSHKNFGDSKNDEICNIDGKVGANHCCGDTSYSPQEEICCNDIIHPVYPHPDNLTIVNECCGRSIFQVDGYTSYFDRSNFICCGDAVFERSSIHEECCGPKIYNASDSVCCNGVVIENPAINHVCCGTASYNSVTSMCCGGNVYPLSLSSQDCCIYPENFKETRFNVLKYYSSNSDMQRFHFGFGLESRFGIKKLRQYQGL